MSTNNGTVAKPPYLAYKTFTNFLASLKEGVIPTRIDRSMKAMAGQSGSTQSYLMSTLKFFQLINEEGTPLPALEELVKMEGDERKKILRPMIEVGYAPILGNLDLMRATTSMLYEKFRALDLNGATLRKCHSFFAAAATDAGISLAPELKPNTRATGTRKVRKPRGNTGTPVTNDVPPPPSPPPVPRSMHELLLSKFPDFDPSWSEDLKTKWFDGYEKLLKAGTDPAK